MAVLKRNRGESPMEFLNTAHELEVYTIKRSSHDIPKAYTFSLKNPINESVRKMNQYVVYANSIFPTKLEEYERRRKFQKSAIIELQNLLELLRLASEIVTIKDTVLEEWVGLVLKEEHSIKKWAESDKKRYKTLQ